MTLTQKPSYGSYSSRRMSIGWERLYYLFCGALVLIFAFPIVWSIVTSLKPSSEASASPPTFLPSYLSFDNYVKLNDFGEGILRHVGNSVTVACLTVIGTIVISVLGGYGWSLFELRGKSVLFVAILITLMIPFQTILTPLFIILRTLGMHNTLHGLSLVYITFQLPFAVFVMRNSFDSVPRELEEAALLDGCTPLTLLYRVMLGIVRPGIITVGLFAFFNAWNEYFAALTFMTSSRNFTLPVLLASVQSGEYGRIDWGALQAGITITMLPCLILFLLMQRYYISGLTAGAVK